MNHDQQHFDERAATWDDDPVRSERAAVVAREILQRIDLGAEGHVLDFGAGTGLLGFHFLSHAASVTFADPSEGMRTQLESKLAAGGYANGQALLLDPEATTLPRGYDAIVSLMTLHHVPDPPAALRLLVEHLEPGGWLAICDLDREDGSFHDDPRLDVHHGFDRGALAAQVTELGLEAVETSTPWVMRKEGESGTKEYPLFLLIGRKAGGV